MFTVIYVATGYLWASIGGAVLTVVFLSSLWFVFPWTERRQQRQNQV
jgi:cbb3-type cytochrome oxidase subunit 3